MAATQTDEQRALEALGKVKDPELNVDIVTLGMIEGLSVAGGTVTLTVNLTTPGCPLKTQIEKDVRTALAGVPGVTTINLTMGAKVRKSIEAPPDLIPEVANTVAIGSGKGGVGKSTVAVNLALALARAGRRTGLLDVDIYGPSVPTMFGIGDRPVVIENRIQPFQRWGVKVMSLGFVLETDTPVIWRGPMVMKAIEQMLGDVDWGELDVLVLDLPPGTGDAQLTVTQKVPLAGAVIVTTPQDVALIDARKGLAMFRKVDVPVLGIIENMASFVCPECGTETAIFRAGGGERTARELGVPFLGSIPLDPAIAEGGDLGQPIVVAQANGPHARAFEHLAETVIASLERMAAAKPATKR